MLSLLAQSEPTTAASLDGSHTVFDVIAVIFSNGDALAQPQHLVEALRNMSIVSAIVFLVVGLLCLFQGYRYYKVITAMLALLVGACVGYALGKRIGAEWIVAGCTGVLMATICFPLMKYAVALMGGLTGAYVGANAWSAIARLTMDTTSDGQIAQHYWIGAIVGLVMFGMLAFILFKLSVIVFTSVSGSTITVLGVIALLLHLPSVQDAVASSLAAHATTIPLLVLVPALIGLILQETDPQTAKKAA